MNSLKKRLSLIDQEVDRASNCGGEAEWIEELKDEIHLERQRTFNHAGLLEKHARQRETLGNVEIDLSSMSLPKTGSAGEGGSSDEEV